MVPTWTLRVWLYVALVVLNAALFLPLFLSQGGPTDFLPFTPAQHPYGAYAFDARSVAEYAKSLILRRANLDVFRLSLEFVALAVLVLAMPTRAFIRRLCAALYALLLFFLSYQHAYRVLYRVEPALWEDIDLLPSLLGFARESWGLWVPVSAALLVIIAAVVVFLAAERTFAALQSRATPLLVVVALGLAVACGASAAWFGVERDDPVMQVVSKFVVRNYRESVARRERLLELQRSGVDDTYFFAHRAKLHRKPRVYLLMIEAYGQRLFSDTTLAPAHRETLRRASARLEQTGFSARTAFSAAPVYGGKSWLSIATVQTGVRISSPSIYAEMAPRARHLATFTRFFQAQGYRTASLQPGNYLRDDSQFDPWARDVTLEFKDLDYGGPHYGYVGVPD